MHLDGIAMPGSGVAPNDGLSDDVLAKATWAGDTEAFATLYRRHAGTVREHVARWVLFPSQHEDLVQEVFTHALAEIMAGQYRPTWTPEGFADWLIGSVADAVFAADKRTYWADFKAEVEATREIRGGILAELREQRAASQAPASASDSMREHLAAETDADSVRAHLLAALGALTPECRRVLELRYFEGLSIEQTAVALGCDRERVRWLRERGIGQLRAADLAPLARPGGRRERKKGRTDGLGGVYLFSRKPAPPPMSGHWADRLQDGPRTQGAARQLRERIASGAYGAPGSQLPSLRALAAELGYPSTTIERAVRQLVGEGIICNEPRRGYFITPPDGPPDTPAPVAYVEQWRGYVWATNPDGTQERRWVYGRTREECQAKWDRVHAEVTANLAEVA